MLPVTIAAAGTVLLFVLAATISPGGATTLATASGSQFGFRRSIPLLAGIAVGLASLAAAASLGLASLMLAVPGLQLAAQLIGSAYLLWLAWGIARSGSPKDATLATPRRFLAGLILLWLNPKGWAMTLSAAAAFSPLASGPLPLAALLTVAFGLGAAASLTLWCYAGLLLTRLLHTEAQWRALNIVLALLLIACIVPMWL